MAEVRRREERRERRRIRRERRMKRLQEGLAPVDDASDSSDSGYSGRSTSTLVRCEEGVLTGREGEEEQEEVKKLTPRRRRICDKDGNLLYEEEVQGPEKDDGSQEGDTEDGRKERKKVKRTRRYTRDRTLPDGTVVREMVESDQWTSEGERSDHSNQDSITAEIDKAKLKRQRERRSMMERSMGATAHSFVTRPEVERDRSPERSIFTLPKIVHKFARGKMRWTNNCVDVVRNIPDSDRFLPQYHDKKQTESRLEDEGFWEDTRHKNTSVEVFDFDNMDAILDKSIKSPPSRENVLLKDSSIDIHVDDGNEIEENKRKRDSVSRRGILSSGRPGRLKHTRLPTIEGPSGFVSGSHDDTCEELPSVTAENRNNEHARILASLSRLLTERLFRREGAGEEEEGKQRQVNTLQTGRVILVGERPSSAQSESRTRNHSTSSQKLGHSITCGIQQSPDDQSVFYTSESMELPPLSRHRNAPRGKLGIGPERAALLRYGLNHNRGLVGRLIRAPRPMREAWSDRDSEVDVRTWSLQDRSLNDPVNTTDASEDLERSLQGYGYLDLDDARLRRLLEELYKDKKYMDAMLAAEASSCRDDVKALAEYGRNYLLQMALYWEMKGPLPPRPSTTALGFKLERTSTVHAQRAQTAKLPEVEKNSTTPF